MPSRNRSFIRLFITGAGVTLVFVLAAKSVYAQSDTIRIDTNLVTIPVSVLDRDGRYIPDLRKEDFRILEDNLEQEIARFETTKQGITVFLLLDVSGSMFQHLPQLTNAANAFVGQLRPDDQLIVATFDQYTNLLFGAKSVKEVRENKSIRLRINGSAVDTMIYDAAEFAFKKMRRIRGRKAIVLFSDGYGSGYTASSKSNIRDAEEGETPIYTVTYKADIRPLRSGHESEKAFRNRQENSQLAEEYMRSLARVSGGRNRTIQDVADLESTFLSFVQELSQQYSLSYYPSKLGKGGERRRITVQVRIPDAVVRARAEYIFRADNK